MKEKLTHFEHTCLWAAIRYFCNRQTISSVSFPADIIQNWYKYLTVDQKYFIFEDLDNNFKKYGMFGDINIDHTSWFKFMQLLNEKDHFKVETTTNEFFTCFKVNGKIYTVEKYIEFPFQDWFLPEENIKTYL